jgi:hypothetical protein
MCVGPLFNIFAVIVMLPEAGFGNTSRPNKGASENTSASSETFIRPPTGVPYTSKLKIE